MVILKDKSVKFRLFSPGANEVQLVGDFTCWRTGQIRMTRSVGGYWNAEIPLAEGIYHFRYQVDGQWVADESVCKVDDGPFGVDSVVWVMPMSTAAPAGRTVPRAVDARIGLPGPRLTPVHDYVLSESA
jgi:1,4-alpha-glucan branching enzyme